MTIYINLSEEIRSNINNNHLKTIDVINHILNTNKTINTDITERKNTALKDLYIIDPLDNNKYYCQRGSFDIWNNRLELLF